MKKKQHLDVSKWATKQVWAVRLGVSVRTIDRRIADGTLKAKKFGGKVMIHEEWVAESLESAS